VDRSRQCEPRDTLHAERCRLVAPINAGTAEVWTGVGADGNPAGANCNGWISPLANGRRGFAGSADAQWTSVDDASCSVARAVYCFEQ
jgi:hypothetical protein